MLFLFLSLVPSRGYVTDYLPEDGYRLLEHLTLYIENDSEISFIGKAPIILYLVE